MPLKCSFSAQTVLQRQDRYQHRSRLHSCSSGNVINATFIRARVENCGGGAVDLTYAGDHNDVEIQHFYYAQQVPALTTLGFVGTPTPRNRVQILVSYRSFVPTTQRLNAAGGTVQDLLHAGERYQGPH